MTFKMSLRALIEEELVEVKAICDGFEDHFAAVLKHTNENARLDHKNDERRLEARKHLLAALRSYNMKDYEDMGNHVHAALSKMHDQEQEDLKDDVPRVAAVAEISRLQEKMRCAGKNIRNYLGKLQQEVTENDQARPTVS